MHFVNLTLFSGKDFSLYCGSVFPNYGTWTLYKYLELKYINKNSPIKLRTLVGSYYSVANLGQIFTDFRENGNFFREPKYFIYLFTVMQHWWWRCVIFYYYIEFVHVIKGISLTDYYNSFLFCFLAETKIFVFFKFLLISLSSVVFILYCDLMTNTAQ